MGNTCCQKETNSISQSPSYVSIFQSKIIKKIPKVFEEKFSFYANLKEIFNQNKSKQEVQTATFDLINQQLGLNKVDKQRIFVKIAQAIKLQHDKIIEEKALISSIAETVSRFKIHKKQLKTQSINVQSTSQFFINTLSQILSQIAADSKYLDKLWSEQGYVQKDQCPICLVVIKKDHSATLQACTHTFHMDCIKQHIKHQINMGQIQIKCPMQKCEKNLTPADIGRFVSDKNLLDKYYQFTFNKYVENRTNRASWCLTPGCTAIFQIEGVINEYKCKICHKHYCLKCKNDFHQELTCEQYSKINKSASDNDKKFQSLAKIKNYKQCPNCKFWVEKIMGCAQVKCKCGVSFCYSCGSTTCRHGQCEFNDLEFYIRNRRIYFTEREELSFMMPAHRNVD